MESHGTDSDETAWQQRLRVFLRSLPKPCALFAATDDPGVEVIAAAHYCGIDVPGELVRSAPGVSPYGGTCPV